MGANQIEHRLLGTGHKLDCGQRASHNEPDPDVAQNQVTVHGIDKHGNHVSETVEVPPDGEQVTTEASFRWLNPPSHNEPNAEEAGQ